MSNRTKGLLFAFVSSILYGAIPLLGKAFVSNFHPLFVAFILTSIVGLYFAVITLWRKDLFDNFKHKEIIWVVLLGMFAALGSIFAFFGLSVGNASHAGFFFQFEAFFAAILAFFFLKEKLSKIQIRGLVIMGIGAYVFGTSFSYSFEIENLFFLCSAFLWGANDVIVKNKIKHFSPFFLAFGRSFFSLIILFPISFRYIPENLQKLSIEDSFYFLFYGLIVAGTILLLYIAFRHVKTAEATSYLLFSPIITAVAAFFIFGERLSTIQLIGGAIILGGLFLMTKKSR